MLRFVLGIIIGILCLVFFIQNSEIITANFLFWTITLPRSVMLIIVLGAGLFLGWIVSSTRNMKRRKRA